MRSAITVISSLLLGLTAVPGWAADSPRILFASKRDGNYEIYVMKADGTDQKRLTKDPGIDVFPVAHPDGERYMFQSNRSGKFDLYIGRLDGKGKVENLTQEPGSHDGYAAISADGKWVAFHSQRTGKGDIYVMSIKGGKARRLSKNPAWDCFPTFSPDGKQIAYASQRDGVDQLRVIQTDGKGKDRLVLHKPDKVSGIGWSPDGKKLVYSIRIGKRIIEIWTIGADGKDDRRLSKQPAADELPSFSPDGKLILFHSQRDKNHDVYSMTADGTKTTRLTKNAAVDGFPVWCPPAKKKSN